MHAVFAPVLDGRDARAGRMQETFGEDPHLVTEMGLAYVRGVQSNYVIATIKHFVANFVGVVAATAIRSISPAASA